MISVGFEMNRVCTKWKPDGSPAVICTSQTDEIWSWKKRSSMVKNSNSVCEQSSQPLAIYNKALDCKISSQCSHTSGET